MADFYARYPSTAAAGGGSTVVTQGTSPWVVSGTVAATQGTSPWVISGAVTQGTSPWVVSGTTTSSGALYADSVYYSYAAPVDTSTWTQLIASTAATINSVTIFDSSGQLLELGIGAAASETRTLLVPPGGLDGSIPLRIVAGTRVSIRAITANATVGFFAMTGLQ